MISFYPFWKTLKEKHVSQYYLIQNGLSPGQLQRLKHNQAVSTDTIQLLCRILNCPVTGIMEYVPLR